MIELIAKDNAIIQTINGCFPFGQRNVAKIFIQDDVIKSKLNLKGNGQCLRRHNQYFYGHFDNEKDTDNIKYSHTDICYTSGINDNTSSCLHINIYDTEDSYIKFRANKTLKPNIEYLFSFICTEKQLNDITTNIDVKNINISKFMDGWYLYKSDTFTVDKETEFYFTIADKGLNFYIDNISLFESKYEFYDSANISAEIEIINPKQDITINKQISWTKTEDDNVCLTLFVPPITVADYKDSITCKFNIYENLDCKYKSTFGNITYTKDKDIIYQSDIFNLYGFILGTDIYLDVEDI